MVQKGHHRHRTELRDGAHPRAIVDIDVWRGCDLEFDSNANAALRMFFFVCLEASKAQFFVLKTHRNSCTLDPMSTSNIAPTAPSVAPVAPSVAPVAVPKPKRVNRPRKPAAAKEVAAPVEAAAEPTTDVPASSPAPAAEPVVESTVAESVPSSTLDQEDHKYESAALSKRKQAIEALGSPIAPARIRRYMDPLFINRQVNQEVRRIKSLITGYRAALEALSAGGYPFLEETTVDGVLVQEEKIRPFTPEELASNTAIVDELKDKMPRLEAEFGLYSRERIRFSDSAAATLSVVANKIVENLMTHAIANVVVMEKSIVQIGHLHSAGLEDVALYPLISTLPVFVSTAKKCAETQAKHDYIINEHKHKVQAYKDVKVECAIKRNQLPSIKNAPAPGTVPSAITDLHEPASGFPDETKPAFKFYVNVTSKKVVLKNEAFAGVRISNGICQYLSELLVQFVHRVTILAHRNAMMMNVKTITDESVLHVIESFLIAGKPMVETLSSEVVQIPDPESVEAERAAKRASKRGGPPYTPIGFENLPKVDSYVAVKTFSFPTSGYDELKAEAKERVAAFLEVAGRHSKDGEGDEVPLSDDEGDDELV